MAPSTAPIAEEVNMNPWATIVGHAEKQFGLVTRAQCKAAGLSEDAIGRRLTSAHLIAELPHVYRIGGVPRSRLQRLEAFFLWVGSDHALSHGAAGEVLRLDGFPLGAIADAVAVTVKRGERSPRKRRDVALHRTTVLPGHHRKFVDGIGCTSAARTIVDLAGSLDAEALTQAGESARRMGIMAIAELERVMRDLDTRRPGIAKLRAYVETNRGQPALQYLLEVKLASLLLGSSLPPFVRQHPVAGTPYRLDFARPDLLLAVEGVGFRWHGNVLQWKQDLRRVAVLEHAGWRVLFITWDDVTIRGGETIERIGLAIEERLLAA
jgi:very-short-patch-repair endonuclease